MIDDVSFVRRELVTPLSLGATVWMSDFVSAAVPEAQEAAGTVYTNFAQAWNSHVDGSGTIQWEGLAALAAGAACAAIVVFIYNLASGPLVNSCLRTRISFQCPVMIYVAPDADSLPYMYPAGRSRFAPSRTRGTQTRATWGQWNTMRVALGSRVPDKTVYDLLQKHGDDTRSAVDDFYGF